MFDEPRRHPLYLLMLALLILGGVPFAFIGREPSQFLGLPVWLWSSALFTVGLSVATAWGILRYWKDDRLE